VPPQKAVQIRPARFTTAKVYGPDNPQSFHLNPPPKKKQVKKAKKSLTDFSGLDP